jgi:dTDP-4-amino-4,6-dideoxygalactose transaminase
MTADDATSRPVVSFAEPEVVDQDVDAVCRVLRSGWLTTGPECEAFESELATYLGVPHVVSVSSGTAALEIALGYLDLPPGARVGVPTWTFVSTALAAVRYGAVPVLLDVDPRTLNVSPAALVEAIADGLDAVVLVHFAGVPVSSEVHQLCRDAGVPVVEDASHALGAVDHRGRVAGHGSVTACFSFYATKNLTGGEGGALATEDAGLARFAQAHRLHGLTSDAWSRHQASPTYDLIVPGFKANMPDVLAALARSQLARIDDVQSRRRRLVTAYREHLAACDGIEPVPLDRDDGSADHLLVVLLSDGTDRRRLMSGLRDTGVETSVHFRPLHHLHWFRAHAEVGPGGAPVADRLAGRALSLPLHLGLREDDVGFVCERIANMKNE